MIYSVHEPIEQPQSPVRDSSLTKKDLPGGASPASPEYKHRSDMTKITFTDDSRTVCEALDIFEHRFNFATAEMSRCVQTASQALIDFSIRELKQMTDCLAENLGISQGLPRRNSKIFLARWVAEMLLSAITVEDAAVAESVAEPVERKAYSASPDTGWVTSYPLSGENSDWCEFSRCPLDEAIRVMCAGTGFGDEFDDDFLDYPRDSRTPLDIKNECSENGRSEYQEGTYPWIVRVEDGLTQDEILKPEPMVPVEPEILLAEPKPVFQIRVLTLPFYCEYSVSETPPYLVNKSGDLFKKSWPNNSLLDAEYHLVFSEHLSNIQEGLQGLLGTDIQLFCDNLSVVLSVVNGVPPLYLITNEGGVYKRMKRQFYRTASVQYAQVVSEHLLNIEVVKNGHS